MTEAEAGGDSTMAEREDLKTRLEEAESENRWLKWVLAATLCFTFYVLWRFS